MLTRHLTRSLALASLFTSLPLVLSACGASTEVLDDDLGSASFALKLADGVELVTVTYDISGNGYSNSGTVDVEKSKTLKFQVAGIPAGSGYVVNLTAAGLPDSGISCTGNGNFDVAPGQATKKNVHLQCKLPKKGSLLVSGEFNVCPSIDGITVLPEEITVGGTVQLLAVASDADGVPAPLSYQWVVDGGELSSDDTAATGFTCTEPGEVNVTLAASDSDCEDVVLTTVTCSPEAGSGGGGQEAILLWNEVESNGGTPDDCVELYNAGTGSEDLSGWVLKDNDDTHVYTIPAGTSIAPGEALILENFGFGLGSGDSARLYDDQGNQVLDYTWVGHAPTTYGRCPDVVGEFGITTNPTKGGPNDCTPVVTFNEVESSGGTPGDWAEIYNAGVNAADLSGYTFKDNDDTHAYVLPAGSTVAPGAYLVLDEAAFGFGLGGADSVRLFSPEGTEVTGYSWTTAAAVTYGRCPNGSGDFSNTLAPTKGSTNACAVSITFNEGESSGGTPGDWVELVNPGTSSVDLSGWTFKDSDDTHAYVLPAGTTVAAGAYLVLDEAAFGFGLGGGDSVRLYMPGGVLVETYTYLDHAATTYGRCPNATGAFAVTSVPTKGSTNACPLDPNVAAPWPGSSDVVTVDPTNAFPSNLSGLHYVPGSTPVLWAALNSPSKIYRLVQTGSEWAPEAGDWAAGKLLQYPGGVGQPDTEGVAKAELGTPGIYVSTERDNSASSVSRLSVLRFDETAAGGTLVATHEWNFTAQLPVVGANLGLEAITWIPDTYLVANGFHDQLLGKTYAPADYSGHGTGLFAVGVEGTGMIYVLALDHVTGQGFIVASLSSGQVAVMDLAFDRDNQLLWSVCDNTCGNQATVLDVDGTGALVVKARFSRPTGLPDSNNEGFSMVPEAECVGGKKSVFWSDDSNFSSHALRQGSVNCGPLF